MLTSLRAALTQQMALQDSIEEMPFTAKQLQRDMDSQEEQIMSGIFQKPESVAPAYLIPSQ